MLLTRATGAVVYLGYHMIKTRPGTMRRLLVGAGWVILVALAGVASAYLIADPPPAPRNDFMEYWAAGRLNANGGNPYSEADLLPVQAAIGMADEQAWPMLNPPWTLALLMPFGVSEYGPGYVVWITLLIAAVLLGADLAWRVFGGEPRKRWLAPLLAIASLPTFYALAAAQITPLVLLGLVAFLSCDCRGKEGRAGAALALAAVKPHLFYLVFPAVLLRSIDRRSGAGLAGLGIALAAMTGVAMATNPSAVVQYLGMMVHRPPARFTPPTIGTFLRMLFGTGRFWLQHVPMLVGLWWFTLHWRRHRRDWNWAEQLPLLLFASLLTAPYGAWLFDLVILVIPLLQATTWACQSANRRGIVGLGVTYALIMTSPLALAPLRLNAAVYYYVPVALLLLYLPARRILTDVAQPAIGAATPKPAVRIRRSE